LFVLIINDDRKFVQLINVLVHRAETRAVRRLGDSTEAICSELPHQSSHLCDQSSTPSCGDGVYSDERYDINFLSEV